MCQSIYQTVQHYNKLWRNPEHLFRLMTTRMPLPRTDRAVVKSKKLLLDPFTLYTCFCLVKACELFGKPLRLN